MSASNELPTIGELISNWLGVQLPAVPMPQTLRNFDKAVGKLLLALGENVETRIKGNTAKTKAQGKINIEGMFRTEEEKRKAQNRAGATKAALEDMRANPSHEDAHTEIDDDWLNVFARLAEDKSSEELQILFGRILAGEVARPGSFSLRTMQTMATISKDDAELLSKLLSFVLNDQIVPFVAPENDEPTIRQRVFLEELGVAGHPTQLGGLLMHFNVAAQEKQLIKASQRGIVIENLMSEPATFSLAGQLLTTTGRELLKIANSPSIDIEFLKKVALKINADLRGKYSTATASRLLKVQVATIEPAGGNAFKYDVVFEAPNE